ncbi:transmembrane amino acid transporter protein-domain-containing protein [Fusarium solani]|uniref:Transmembrane amino acid transporter protein-domain-containing protein n=1 Tax=Fusarium solani TaxID=169388 RepID=A0A9P9K7G9_FUSSL|nr:transmembrane amino acid transporter protein-domain-containing protein [Fusarium solani]KAH7246825.1 transmembrane amino acid transporter protein-domain-containing protein [Fusarium solani]
MRGSKEDTEEGLATLPSGAGEVDNDPTVAHDAVFGNITEKGPNYRDVGWLGSAALMMKSQIGLGVLSIPSAFDALGIIPGIICLLTVAALTSWSDYVIGMFKLRHREIWGIDDAAGLMFGKVGREFLGVAFVLFYIVTIAAAVQDRPSEAPQEGVWVSDYKLSNNPSFADAISAICTFVFAYAGTPLFFPIAAEMRDPRQYTKALVLCQSTVTATYIIIGIMVYYYCGSYVASPALGSAGPVIKKIAYGLALPGLLAGATINAHAASKYPFIRFLRGSRHLTANTFTHWACWLSCTFTVSLSAYAIASGIPIFHALVSLVGALLGTLMCFQPMGCMWLYDNWSSGRSGGRTIGWSVQACVAVFVVVSGMFLTVAGTYGTVVGVIKAFKETKGAAAWSCADNSNSV